MSVRQKTLSKHKEQKKIWFDIDFNDYCEKEINTIVKLFDVKADDIVKVDSNEKGDVNLFSINYENSNLFESYELKINEKIQRCEGGKTEVCRYRYEIKPVFEVQKYFRFDYSVTIPIIYPPYHLNVDNNYWSELGYNNVSYHMSYPDDIKIKLDRLNIVKATKMFRYFIKKGIHMIENSSVYEEISRREYENDNY